MVLLQIKTFTTTPFILINDDYQIIDFKIYRKELSIHAFTITFYRT